MTKKKVRQREPAKPPAKIEYEDTKRFKAIERMMKQKYGVRLD